MLRILQVFGIVLITPDETVHQNLRNVDPVSYLLPFKTFNHDNEYLRLMKSARSTGPVHTYVKTDKNANVKWGVRHFVGKKYA
ncbi:CLUMA_CG009544, isoform A [Clunio marinus]|uniref:CLUMA_CG009544, isoform A n=1 Tax=Clunio marinus TaxID=568069 RepID=A0A1J1I756_9DIPT|nr:CLUMA_CG009544, isoform A [Clunio marinus]